MPVLLCALFLAGCGQKGDLYLPLQEGDQAGRERAH